MIVNKKVLVGFCFATFLAIIQSALLPHLRIFAYAPFLGLLCIHLPFSSALWLAAASGACFDLLVCDPPGFHALNHTLLCAFVHHLRRFLKEQPLQLPLFTALISLISLPLEAITLFLLDRKIEGSISLFDLIEGPILNAAYAFFAFVGPFSLWEWATKKIKHWWLLRNQQ